MRGGFSLSVYLASKELMVGKALQATIAIAISLTVCTAYGATIYVDDNGPNDPGPGDPLLSDPSEDGSAEHPFDTIQEAINAASAGDDVRVLDGVYRGSGNRELNFNGKAITLRSANGNPRTCIIDCERSGRGFVFENNEGPDTKIIGLTIVNGYTVEDGGCVYCFRSSPTFLNCRFLGCQARYGGAIENVLSSPALHDCTFSFNASEFSGGVIENYYSNSIINRCEFNNNSAGQWGGAIYNYVSNPLVTDSVFNSNNAEISGGALCNFFSNPTFRRCSFNNNATLAGDTDNGGAVYNNFSDPIFDTCLFVNNFSTDGGAFYNVWSSPELSHCTLSGNSASLVGGAMLTISGDPVISHSIFWNNTPDEFVIDSSNPVVRYSLIEGGFGEFWFGEGCLDVAPLFIDADGPDNNPASWQDNDYRLAADSPCIDAGDPQFVALGMEDFDGYTRVWDGDADNVRSIDIGAYEFGAYAYGDIDCSGQIDASDISPFIKALLTPTDYAQAYPECDWIVADTNGDGLVDASDISAFIRLLLN